MLPSMKIHKHSHIVLLLILMKLLELTSLCNAANSNVTCNDREKQALIDFKTGFNVELSSVMSSWGVDDQDCCNWQGVKCNNKTRHVISLSLGYAGLKGKIVDSILELKHLRHLDLRGSVLDNIPPFIGSLSKLRYLNFSQVHYPVTTTIPNEIGNITSLQVLDLGYSSNLKWYDRYIYRPASSLGDFYGLTCNNLFWVSSLSSLKYLDLSHVRLSNASYWLHSISKLRFLKHLQMYNCHLPMPNPIPFSGFSDVQQLAFLRLGSNRLNSSFFDWFSNISRPSLTHLDLRGNLFTGQLPGVLWTVFSLEFLDLSDNAFEGDLPDDLLHRLPRLADLSIARNKFAGPFHGFRASDDNNTSLQSLDLSSNAFVGHIPENLGSITSLKKLNLSYNQFTGRIPKSFSKLHNLELLDLSSNGFGNHTQLNIGFFDSITQLSNLRNLDVSSNSLYGTLSEMHLKEFVHMVVFDMSDNFLTLNFTQDWSPPFRNIKLLMLGSCNLGGKFPRWIKKLDRLSTLDLSNCAISDEIPDWFWKHFSGSNVEYLNISFNNLYGSLPKDLVLNSTRFAMTIIDLSHNLLNGSIPGSLMNTTTLSLSHNMFSGNISSICTAPAGNLMSLDLSTNLLSGTIPDCLARWRSLSIINLANNSFSGHVPISVGYLPFLRVLHLRKNNLYGKLPSSLSNCWDLQVLDIAENDFSGSVPAWIGRKLRNLLVISFRKNRFSGKIPLSLCQISTLHVLDLSLNNLSGTIPRCFGNLSAMSRGWSFNPYFVQPICLGYNFWGSAQYADILLLELKGIEREFKSKFVLINLIDLSRNKLTGEIPREVSNLANLISLNLSTNYLTGKIPYDIGQIESLDTLDLSRNQLYGEIPSSLSSLSHLGTLDLSHNNLSGRIPTGTQLQSCDPSAFAENPGLCGLPIAACSAFENPTLTSCPGQDVGDENWTRHFYISMIIGSVVGFWAVFYTSLAYTLTRTTFSERSRRKIKGLGIRTCISKATALFWSDGTTQTTN